MSRVSTPHQAATSSTVGTHAWKFARNPREHAAAMWAACTLMALHESQCRAEWLRSTAGRWADSAKFGAGQ